MASILRAPLPSLMAPSMHIVHNMHAPNERARGLRGSTGEACDYGGHG